jgi:hypothetical protein
MSAYRPRANAAFMIVAVVCPTRASSAKRLFWRQGRWTSNPDHAQVFKTFAGAHRALVAARGSHKVAAVQSVSDVVKAAS